jgi:hypothetical protein
VTRNQTNSNKGDAGLESLWADYLSEVEATGKSSGIDYENLLAALAILNSSDPSKKAQLLLIGARRMYEYQKDLARRQAQIGKDPTFTLAYALRRLIQALLDQNIPLPENELDELLAMAQDKSDGNS